MSRTKGIRADMSVRGLGAVTRCVSAPAEEWAAIDAVATRLQMSRSQLVRYAVKILVASLDEQPAAPSEEVA